MPGSSGKGTVDEEKAATTTVGLPAGANRRAAAAEERSVRLPVQPRQRPARPVAPKRAVPGRASVVRALSSAQVSETSPGPDALAVVVVDPMPLFRAGAVEALKAAGVEVVGEAARLTQGIELVHNLDATAMLLGGATVGEAREAVDALPSCAVVVLLAQPTRTDLVDMLDAGVAGLALRSLTAEELVTTVQAAAQGGAEEGGRKPAPVFVPLPVGHVAPLPAPAGNDEAGLTPKELEILAQLARGRF